MLPKERRMPHTLFVGRPQHKVRTPFGSVSVFAHLPARAAVVVSKKVSKSAVTRNTIRRRVLHALKPLLPVIGVSIVVYPTVEALHAPFSGIRTALEEGLKSR